jgi:uncharacterized protein (DUF488 family)
MNLFTIGYEGLDIDTFMGILKSYSIKQLIDIREYPVSRKAGFSKKALKTIVEHSGITYWHIPKLGCPKDIRHKYRNDGDWLTYTVNFFHYLSGQQESLIELSTIVSTETSCLMCYEENYLRCHRSYVSLILERRYLNGLIISDIRLLETRGIAGSFVGDIRDQLSAIDIEIDELCP